MVNGNNGWLVGCLVECEIEFILLKRIESTKREKKEKKRELVNYINANMYLYFTANIDEIVEQNFMISRQRSLVDFWRVRLTVRSKCETF